MKEIRGGSFKLRQEQADKDEAFKKLKKKKGCCKSQWGWYDRNYNFTRVNGKLIMDIQTEELNCKGVSNKVRACAHQLKWG